MPGAHTRVDEGGVLLPPAVTSLRTHARSGLSGPLSAEAGFAVPIVMIGLVVVFALASVTVMASVGAQRGTVRDQQSKAALAAAEAGVSEALLHYNRIPVTTATPCLVGSPAAPAAAAAGGWCQGVTRNLTGVEGATFTYWVLPSTGQIEIVSQGSIDGVTRRVDVVARSSSGLQPFTGLAGVIGLDFINMNSNGRITANVATNGDITMNSNAELNCSYARIGVGRAVITNSNAHYSCPSPDQGPTSLPPINQGDVATNNSNGNFFGVDTYTSGAPSWNPTTRQLTLNSNTTLTMRGSNYSFCRLTLNSNSQIIVPSGGSVSMYFDTPEACGLSSPATQLSLNSNSRIAVTGANATQVALLFAGSDTRVTRATLNSNTQANLACEQDFVIYAPRTAITLNSNSYFCGAMAGKSIQLDSNADIRNSNNATDFQLANSVAQHYVPEEFLECSIAAASPPDAAC